ncbi:hypothetical protein AAC387_Pa01g2673 [Persea americana]
MCCSATVPVMCSLAIVSARQQCQLGNSTDYTQLGMSASYMCVSATVPRRIHLMAILISVLKRLVVQFFYLKRDSSPGPDGFSGHFFSATWNIIGPTVIKAVKQFLKSRKLYRAANTFFITLIPKIQSPTSFADFRPPLLISGQSAF